jgi:hypothetical protein
MDTIETPAAPVGEADVTASPDTATQVNAQTAEPAESSVDGATEGEAGQAQETLLAGKYKSPEELAKAYKELESKLGETGRKAALANKLEQVTGMNAQELEVFLEQQEEQRLAQEMQNNPGGYALKEVQTLKKQLAYQQEEKELDGFLQKNPEYAPFRDKILNLGLHLEIDKSYEEIATEYFGQARAQGQSDAYKKIETKKAMQATSVQSAPQKRFSADDMKGMSVAEMEAILPKSDRLHY